MKFVSGALNDVRLLDILRASTGKCRSIRAAVAYADASNPLFDHCRDHAVRLEYYGLLDAGGAVPVVLLEKFLEAGNSRVECRLVYDHYHPKVIWWEGFGAYVGSANLTGAAWNDNIECGVFFDADEIDAANIGDELDALLDHVRAVSIPLSPEILDRLKSFENMRRALRSDERALRDKFNEMFRDTVANRPLVAPPDRRARSNAREIKFVAEWRETLQLLRSLAAGLERLDRRPAWVAAGVERSVHFDQFLHAYYYVRIRGGGSPDDDDERSSRAQVERAYESHRNDPAAALVEGATWWAGLRSGPFNEDEFIATTAPALRALLTDASLTTMDRDTFFEAMRSVNAFQEHSRQVRNDVFGLPPDHHESKPERVRRLADWLWTQRSERGHGVIELLRFVLWADRPTDMETRLWMAKTSPEWRIQHLGQSILGETVGWARPDQYPPRNNRTNKALRSLGYDVKIG